MSARTYLLAAWFTGEHNGPEALTVERPVETRQRRFEHFRDHRSDAWRNGSAPARQAGGWRFDSSRVDEHQGQEPDGDGTALIPRDDVVQLHAALPSDE
jgi:hypothetical protein